MWNKSAVTVAALLIALGSLGVAIYEKLSAPKFAYVRIKDMFEKFDMKKEEELKFQQQNSVRQHMLDSMAYLLQAESNLLQSQPKPSDSDIATFNAKKQDYFNRKQQFTSDQQFLTQNVNDKIIARMTQYVKDYGKANGYTYIFGDDGNGNLMYAKDADDLTLPMTDYINKCYAGEKK